MIVVILLSSCANVSFDTNPEEEIDTLINQPALADYLEEQNIPQDDRWHFSATAGTDTDKTTGAKGGHLMLKVKVAWPTPTPTPSPTPRKATDK